MADEEKAEPRLLAEVEIDVGRFHALLRDGRRLTSDEAPDLVRVISEGDAPERAEARLGTPDSARMFVIPESLTEVAVVGVGAHLDVLSLEVRRCMSIVVARGDGPSTDRLNALCEPGSVRLRIVEGPQAETDFGRWVRACATEHFTAHGLSIHRARSLSWLVCERVWLTVDLPRLGKGRLGSAREYPVRYRLAVRAPVMGQTFALGQIYQPLRARCRRAGSPNDWALVRADAELRSWIESSLDGDAIRVVSGGPGAGKSSLARMLAAWCQANGEPVFYIPLHAFDLGQDLASAIIEAHRSEWHQSTGVLSFFEGDAALPVHDTDSLVLILDGLDELAAGGRAAERAVGTLFESVERLLRDHELPTRGRLRVLLLGREVVVQAHEARCRKPGQVLHLLPYFILPADVERYHDPKGLARHDQRHDWWRRYGELTGQDFDGLPAELDRPQLAELTAEPLLNLLVALTWEAGNLDFSRDDIGLPAIYADLVRQVFERSYSPSGKLHGVAGIKLDDYRQFLEAVAVAAWHGAGRTTTAEEIQEVAGRRLLAKMDVLQQGVEDGVGRLITAFYFRSQGEGDQGRIYEFTHQSFAEALLARRIMRFIERLERQARRWVEDDDGWDLETRLVEWYRLFGPAALDPNTVRFVRQEFAARGVEVTERWRGLLVEMLHAVIARDWPIETAGPRLAFREEVARGRHASAALLAMAAAASDILCTRVAIGPKQGPSVGFSVWWAALRRDGTLDGVLTMALRWWVFDANEISSHMNLEDCDLSHTLWDEGVEFVQDNLAGTLLYGVDLAGVWIEDCIWAGAKADGATVWPEGFDPQAAGVIVRETAP